MTKFEEMRYLIGVLNKSRDEYYNKANPSMSDAEYDMIFDKLRALESETKTVYPDSPTTTVGYSVLTKLAKVDHNHHMLSLDKTKSVEEVLRFMGTNDCLAMLKMDGLTTSLMYNEGRLVRAETRGDGMIGEDVTHNVMCMANVPKIIPYLGKIIIDGEVISTYDNFDKINAKLPENEAYKHIRNFASGSLRQLDSHVTAKRGLSFVAWKLIESTDQEFKMSDSFCENLDALNEIGFTVVPFVRVLSNSAYYIEACIKALKKEAEENSYPIDGIVFSFNSVDKIKKAGETAHHCCGQFAFKFENDLYESRLKGVEWNVGRNEALTPVAVFEPIEMDDGTTVERASLHNVSIIESLGLQENCTVYVAKMNEIIPQVQSALQNGTGEIKIPDVCPVCGAKTAIKQDNQSKVLVCTNPACGGKLLGKLSNFVSRPALNIDGLSDATLTILINKGWVKKFIDLYSLNKYKAQISIMQGFGARSCSNLLAAIEKSKNTTLDHFIVGLGIPGIGKSAAKTIAAAMDYKWGTFVKAIKNRFRFDTLADIGGTTNKTIYDWADNNLEEADELADLFNFNVASDKKINSSGVFAGKTFVVTGALKKFTRTSIEEKILSVGGKMAGSVSKKTDYLLTNDSGSGSSKAVKAKELGVKIISEDEFLGMLNE